MRTRLSAIYRRLLPSYVIAVETMDSAELGALLPAEAACLGNSAPKRMREFAAGRVCARRALAQIGVEDFPIIAAQDRQPIWPESVVGSITHTDGYCAAAVADRARCLGIGIDSELIEGGILRLAHRICVPAELHWLETLPAAQRPSAVTMIFCSKEAFYKFQYPIVAEKLGFGDLRIAIADWRPVGNGGDERRAVFSIHPTRPLMVTQHAALPIRGRYLFHGQFVSSVVCLPARRRRAQ
ncbi:MAG: 4'-phosphopantetheinyl transferase superfamily protein [Gammaproteobacteria bacterium]